MYRYWHQLNIPFENWDTVEHDAVTRLGPAITGAERTGLIDAWFFMRKAERSRRGDASQDIARPRPCWRVRILPAEGTNASETLDSLQQAMPGATPAIYEPEVPAFGGPAGMALAHTLFHQDSCHILTYLDHLGAFDLIAKRRELAMLLCSRLFRAAGQDFYEQGDVWARVAENRRPAYTLPSETVQSLQPAVYRLMTVDTAHLTCDPGSGQAAAADWFAAFDSAGEQLGRLARGGLLERGIRAVLAHHVLFAFNRIGLASDTQTLLAHAASKVVFD